MQKVAGQDFKLQWKSFQIFNSQCSCHRNIFETDFLGWLRLNANSKWQMHVMIQFYHQLLSCQDEVQYCCSIHLEDIIFERHLLTFCPFEIHVSRENHATFLSCVLAKWTTTQISYFFPLIHSNCPNWYKKQKISTPNNLRAMEVLHFTEAKMVLFPLFPESEPSLQN